MNNRIEIKHRKEAAKIIGTRRVDTSSRKRTFNGVKIRLPFAFNYRISGYVAMRDKPDTPSNANLEGKSEETGNSRWPSGSLLRPPVP